MKLYVFGSSLTSAYWNGAATYYRGIYKNLHALGYRITFAEPDVYGRLEHRDWPAGEDPAYASCPVYRNRAELDWHLRQARAADVVVKHSGVGTEDGYLEEAVIECARAAPAGARPRVAFWDVDAPATLADIEADAGHPMRRLLPEYDLVLTYGGGDGVERRYRRLGARQCRAIYNGLDPETHYPVAPVAAWRSHLTFLGHRLPDRDERVRSFFFEVAARRPEHRFVLAGEGWSDVDVPGNVVRSGYIRPGEHNRLNCSAQFVLNLNRASMVSAGYSPPTRIFEAAGAGAAIISDAWPGIETFFEPGREILVAASPAALGDYLDEVSPDAARRLGTRARERALAEHSYQRRAAAVDQLLHANSRIPADAVVGS